MSDSKRAAPNLEVAELRAQGLAPAEIARRLGKPRTTVRDQLKQPKTRQLVEELREVRIEEVKAGIRKLIPAALETIRGALTDGTVPRYVAVKAALQVCHLAFISASVADEASSEGLLDPLEGLDELVAACDAAVGRSASGGAGGAIGELPEVSGGGAGDRASSDS